MRTSRQAGQDSIGILIICCPCGGGTAISKNRDLIGSHCKNHVYIYIYIFVYTCMCIYLYIYVHLYIYKYFLLIHTYIKNVED